jgi:tetratricopeptide (TPR) repeat protein
MNILIGLLLIGAEPAADFDTALDDAAYLFFNRHLDESYLDSAFSLLLTLHEQEPTSAQALYLWSRIHIQLGDNARTRGEKMDLFRRARAIADTLRTVAPTDALGHTWWGVAHGRIGQTQGVLNSLFMVPDFKRAFGRALELDPDQTTAHDALGVLYYELPSVAGGDLRKAEAHFQAGIKIDPDYALLYLDLAKVYIRQKRWQQARDQLNALLAIEAPTYPGDFYLDDRPEAEALLREIQDK